MTNKPTNPTEQVDLKEVVGHIDSASSLLAHAAESFAGVCAIFESIRNAAPSGSLISRLAQLGINNCELHDCDFAEHRDSYNSHVERYLAALDGDKFQRFQSAEESSNKGGT